MAQFASKLWKIGLSGMDKGKSASRRPENFILLPLLQPLNRTYPPRSQTWTRNCFNGRNRGMYSDSKETMRLVLDRNYRSLHIYEFFCFCKLIKVREIEWLWSMIVWQSDDLWVQLFIKTILILKLYDLETRIVERK